MSTRLIVMQGADLIADVDDYEGPVPTVGNYIFHPPLNPQDAGSKYWDGGIDGCVKMVTLSIYGRSQNGEDHFTGRNTNIIEVQI